MIAEIVISDFWLGLTLGFFLGVTTLILIALAHGKR